MYFANQEVMVGWIEVSAKLGNDCCGALLRLDYQRNLLFECEPLGGPAIRNR